MSALSTADVTIDSNLFLRDLVLALQAALLVCHAPSAVAEAFCASRLADEAGGAFGMLPAGTVLRPIIERAGPG